MDPHVYPDPQNEPLHLASGAENAVLIPIEQLTSTLASGDQVMFIRVAMSSPDGTPLAGIMAPTISLQARTPGDPPDTQVTSLPNSIYKAPGTNAADYIADGEIIVDPVYNNVYIVTITIASFSVGAYDWKIRIHNNEPAARDFTWVVSGTQTSTVQPWIDAFITTLSPTTLSYNLLIGETKASPVEVRNKGTGPLTVTGLTPALPAELVLGTLPPIINPGLKGTFTITFSSSTPVSLTPNPVIDISPDDTTAVTTSGHNQQLSISANAQALEVVLLLDASGSMGWLPNGNTTANASLTRLSELKTAVNNTFLELLFHFYTGRGKFSIAQFPPADLVDNTTADVQTLIDIPALANLSTYTSKVTAIMPIDSTPMGEGIERVLNSTQHFSGNLANRRILVLMSDGAENASTPAHHPTHYIGCGGGGTTLCDKKVSVLAVGYGLQGNSGVDLNLLEQLRAGSFDATTLGVNQVLKVDQDGRTATELRAAFKQAIVHGLTTLASPRDPSAVFYSNQSEVRHSASVTPYDGKAAFSIGWNTPDAELLRLELLTPNCELITPENAEKDFSGVVFIGDERSQSYLIDAEFVQGTEQEESAGPRYGNWIMKVTSPRWSEVIEIGFVAASAGTPTHIVPQENYTYDVILESQLLLELQADQSTYFAGDPIRVSALVTANGMPVKDAAVILSTTLPTQSVANWLASLEIPEDILKQAQEMFAGKDSSPLMIKAVAAGLMGLSFPGGYGQGIIPMIETGPSGNYEAVFSNTSTPEQYTLYVTAIGVTQDGVSFQREGKVERMVLVKPEKTTIDLRFVELGLANVLIWTSDRFGNVLVNPPTSVGLSLLATGADLTTPLTSNLNGSYGSQIKFDPNTTPTLSVVFDGTPLIEQTVPRVGKLNWVDRVRHFQPGAEAARGANQHLDPNAALGSLFDKQEDVYVSLGAHGVLIVDIKNKVIQPAGKADITVFVPPTKDPRSYRVYVYVPPRKDNKRKPPTDLSKDGWIVLGESAGATASFSLSDAKVRSATAIAILDLSGQTRGRDGTPLPDPGVSIRAVGVEKVRKQRGEDDNDDDRDDDKDDDRDDKPSKKK